MDKTLFFTLFLIISIGITYYFLQEDSSFDSNPELELPGPEVAVVEYVEPEISVPIEVEQAVEIVEPTQEPADVLPSLDESDEPIKQRLTAVYTNNDIEKIFLFDQIVRKFVVTIDNMTAKKLPQRFKFTPKPAGKFDVRSGEKDDEYYLDEKNYIRYEIFVRFLETVDLQSLVNIYIKFYPLFQKAYWELGYPDKNFNDRLIQIIDHLLDTPRLEEPVKLEQPKVFYQFADQELETLSAGQKTLIRIGDKNGIKVKAKFEQVKKLLKQKQ